MLKNDHNKSKEEPTVLKIGHNRECFFDDYLIDTERTTAEFLVHHPIRRGVVMRHDEMWEGNCCDYHNFFYDNGVWRMYYLGWWYGYGKSVDPRVCYAESRDGIHWEKPNLGLIEFNGSKNNNIVLDQEAYGQPIDNFMVFRDDNPACPPEEKYKGIARYFIPKDTTAEELVKNEFEPIDTESKSIRALWYFVSPDGFHWKRGGQICADGAYDTLNIVFWDDTAKKYRCYYRAAHHPGETAPLMWFGENDLRDIRYIESEDFKTWSEQKLLDFAESEDIPLYTNVVQPYHRAPQILIGFPSRYIYRRSWNGSFEELCGKESRLERMKDNERYGLTVTDCVFMSSRDGWHFNRPDEAFIRPEPEEPCGWVYGTAYPSWGLIETPGDIEGQDNELSIYLFENHWSDKPADFVRYTIRCDGFMSLHAGAKEKLIVTKPFLFDGSELRINFATSARGYLYITLEAEDGTTVESCETFGNSIDRRVHMDGDVSALAGKAVTMKVRMLDADLYAIRFC